ncbi:MAG TPA: hypothetical protein VI524_07605, partial [Anaerolineales bacterium]|nr:hypothetical protein [Anaerolineales bacterium]
SPFLSILPGDLQTVFIDPQVHELEALGVEIRYDSAVCDVVVHEGAVATFASSFLQTSPRGDALALS